MAQTRYVNTASTVGTQDGTTRTPGNSGTAAFATLRQALDAVEDAGALSEPWTIQCEGSAADTTEVGQFNANTTATNNLTIESHPESRHSGSWNTGIYRLALTNLDGIYNNTTPHLVVRYMQVQITVTDASEYYCFKSTNANLTVSGCVQKFHNNLARGVLTSGNVWGIWAGPWGAGGSGTVQHWNNITWNCSHGFITDNADAVFYNNTHSGGTIGFYANGANMIAKNCLATNTSSADFTGTFSSSNNNASQDTTAPGTSSRISQTFTFVDAANGDFHLTSGDAGAKDFGVSDPGSGLFSDDIDGVTRTGTWDIGADEVTAGTDTPVSASSGSLVITGGQATSQRYQVALPVSEITDGAWLPSTGADLYATLDDGDDSDYDYTESNSTMEVKFAALSDPQTSSGHTVRYRIKGNGTSVITVSLIQNTTVIASWAHNPAPASLTSYEQTLSSGEADSITDYSDLRLRVTTS